jgi:uncharacterized glyoxalase superfamily protein PhnB
MSKGADGMAEVSSEVEVPVDPRTAFAVFTEELDLWWVRGPINFHDSGRARARRCEPGVGGRLLEVYDDATGDALELGRISEWEPGERLAWQSSLDDVETEVTFEPIDAGTRVRVTARLPEGGADRGGTAWVRVVPHWFGRWAAERDRRPHEVREISRLGLAISYARPVAAARWLIEAFGFDADGPLPAVEGGEHAWVEVRVGGSSVVLTPGAEVHGRDAPDTVTTHVPWVYVDDVRAHYARSEAAGARIVEPLDRPWGLAFYVAADPEGRQWTFAQARPTMRGGS